MSDEQKPGVKLLPLEIRADRETGKVECIILAGRRYWPEAEKATTPAAVPAPAAAPALQKIMAAPIAEGGCACEACRIERAMRGRQAIAICFRPMLPPEIEDLHAAVHRVGFFLQRRRRERWITAEQGQAIFDALARLNEFDSVARAIHATSKSAGAKGAG